MSPEKRTEPLELARTPSGARIVEVSLDEYSGSLGERLAREAYARGLADGRRQVEAEAGALFERALVALDETRQKALAELGSSAIQLAVEIARQLLRIEIKAGHYDLEGIVRDTLAASGVGRGSCVVHLNPADKEKIAHLPFRSGTSIEGDPALHCGDVHVSTEHGLLVRDLDDCLISIGEKLRELVARGGQVHTEEARPGSGTDEASAREEPT